MAQQEAEEPYPSERLYIGLLTVLVSPNTSYQGRGLPSPKLQDPRGIPSPDYIARWVKQMNSGQGTGRRANVEYCVFCKNNDEDPLVYRSHRVKDRLGLVTCPRLQSIVCPRCGASHGFAHTEKHCLLNSVLPIGDGRPRTSSRTNETDRK